MEDWSDLDAARGATKLGDAELLQAIYGNPALILSDLIRTALTAAEGHRLIVCDESAIEARVLAWVYLRDPVKLTLLFLGALEGDRLDEFLSGHHTVPCLWFFTGAAGERRILSSDFCICARSSLRTLFVSSRLRTTRGERTGLSE
jgi:hypothetical protein